MRMADFCSWHGSDVDAGGRAIPLCPGASDINLFGYGEGVVALNAQVAHRAHYFLVPQQKLDGPQVAGAAVDERRLCPAERMRPKEARVEPNASNPLADQSGVLPGRDWSIAPAAAAEQELARLLIGRSDVIVDRLPGLLRHLKPNGLTGLPLAHRSAIDRVTVRSDVLDPQTDDVASAEFTVDAQIKHGQVACSPQHLEFGADRP